MKKIIAFILLLCTVLTFAACTDNGNTTPETTGSETTAPETTATETTAAKTTEPETTEPETTEPENTTPDITWQEVYDAGKDLNALLGNHENVHISVKSNGKLIEEQYFSKQYAYSFFGAEYMNIGFEYSSLTTDHSEYNYAENIYARYITVTPSGIVNIKDSFALFGMSSFISSEMLNDSATITEKDGLITVTCVADPEEIFTIEEGLVSCVETYTLDAKTREMISVKTVYTYENGTVEEGIATITRDVDMPEGMKEFMKFENETENLRTVTIISNPGAENEKTESFRAPKGLQVAIFPDFEIEKEFTIYSDEACTQPFDEWDVNTDLTIYIKWDE